MQLLIAHKDATARAALAQAIAGDEADPDIVQCEDGGETLQLLLSESSPRLAVVDWDLPGVDGPELCRLVRDFHLGGPPYMVLLASSRHSDIGAGLDAGANDCIRTPAGAAEIRERVAAGKRFVEMPWERSRRADMLQAVRTIDDGPPVRGKVELVAVLS